MLAHRQPCSAASQPQRPSQPRETARAPRLSHQDVGGTTLARDTPGDLGNVLAGLHEQPRPQHGCEPAQRLELLTLHGRGLLVWIAISEATMDDTLLDETFVDTGD